MDALRENLECERISTLRLREVITVFPETVVRSAVAQMRFKQLGCAVILDARERPTGIFTERSLSDALIKDASLDNRTVEEFAERTYSQFTASQPIACVWDAVQRHGSRFGCVTDEDGRLIGLTGQRGLAEYVASVSQSAEFSNSPSERLLAEERVTEIQSRPYAELPSMTPIRQAVHALHGLKVASLLVVDEGKLLGIFTERDVLERVAERYARIADAPLSEVMTSRPVIARGSEPAQCALSAIAEAGYRHVPVLNESDEVLGIVSPHRVFAFLEQGLAADHEQRVACRISESV